MDIDLSVGTGSRQDLILSFDPENMSGTCSGDTAYLRVQAHLKRGDTWNKKPLRGSMPILLAIHGHLGNGVAYDGTGATLEPITYLPLDLTHEENLQRLVNLAFVCTRRYIQHFEEERALRNQSRKMTFELKLWGTVARVAPRYDSLETAEIQQIEPIPYGMPKETRIEVVAFEPVNLRNSGCQINVSLSHWDEMLPGLGYPNRRFVELPALTVQSMPDELRDAAEHVNTAHQLFLQEKYRAAVQHCRQARDALLTPNRRRWCQDNLGGVMGTEKAEMVDAAIFALTHLEHPASHGDNQVEVDRDAAEYVIGTMTLILHYIERKLQ
ncbi:MAG TPA: hypothetical protein VKT82_12130 [Ktedonobacterales bacterium]|nr:hypothetical protein [Ktedonobacterales bacterium]